MDQAHILYSGIVQGVGFRFTVQRQAQNLNLNGWVKNLSNGSVEILVQGPKESIETLCQRVEMHFGNNISGKEIQYQQAEHEMTDFQITH